MIGFFKTNLYMALSRLPCDSRSNFSSPAVVEVLAKAAEAMIIATVKPCAYLMTGGLCQFIIDRFCYI